MKKILFSPVGGTDPISQVNVRDGSLLHIARVYQPDVIIMYMSKEVLAYHNSDNRYVYCLEKLDEMLAKSNSQIDAVIKVDVPSEIIMERVVNRRVCTSCGESYNVVSRPTKVEGVCDVCGKEVIQRDDDKPETVKQRLLTYEENTKPLIDFYEKKGIVISADNSKSPDVAFAQASEALAAKGFRKA